MADENLGNFHGWAHGENALYLAPLDDEGRIGLYMQVARESELAGVFIDAAMAQVVMDFLDGALTATAQANSELLRRLETEQPLLFAGPPANVVQPDVESDEEL